MTQHNRHPNDWCVIYDTPTRFNIIDATSYEHAQALMQTLPERYHISSSQLRIAQEKDISYNQLGRLHHVIMSGVLRYRYVYEDGTMETYHGPSIRPDPQYKK